MKEDSLLKLQGLKINFLFLQSVSQNKENKVVATMDTIMIKQFIITKEKDKGL